MSKVSWNFQEVSRNVHLFNVNLQTVGDEQWFLLQSDVHWDNPKCDRKKLKKHLDLALERNAPVLDFGDFFCAMQGKYDRRSSKKDIRPEHQNNQYLDSLVNTAAEYLKPYAKIITVRGNGNHESAINKNHETDLNERLAERIRMDGGIARRGGYSGYIRFQIHNGKRNNRSIKLWYFHGSGGGGPVTRGVIQTNRQAVYVSDADIVASGHVHESWQVAVERMRLNAADRVVLERQTHVKIAGYKEEYEDGYGGWHIETGKPPKPTGAWWLRIYHPEYQDSNRPNAEYELFEAK
jgi:predicted phosphodiesterase